MVSRTLNMVIPLFLNLSTLNSTYWPLIFKIGEKKCFKLLPPVSTLCPLIFLFLFFFFFLASPAAWAREQTYVHSSNPSCSGDNARSLTHWARGTPEILIFSSFVLPNKTSSSSLKTRNTFYVPDSSLSTLYIWAPFIFKINAWDINYFHPHFW